MPDSLATARAVNHLEHDEMGDPVSAAYGPDSRLRELKAEYDLENVFDANINSRPA